MLRAAGKGGCRCSSTRRGWHTALHFCAGAGGSFCQEHVRIIQFLLRNGADGLCKNDSALSPKDMLVDDDSAAVAAAVGIFEACLVNAMYMQSENGKELADEGGEDNDASLTPSSPFNKVLEEPEIYPSVSESFLVVEETHKEEEDQQQQEEQHQEKLEDGYHQSADTENIDVEESDGEKMGESNDKINDLQEKKKEEESDREQEGGEQAWKSEIEDFQMLLLQDETMDESKSAAKGAPNERQKFQLLSFSVLKTTASE